MGVHHGADNMYKAVYPEKVASALGISVERAQELCDRLVALDLAHSSE